MRSARLVSFFQPPAGHLLWGELGKEDTERQVYLGYTLIALCAAGWNARGSEDNKAKRTAYWLFMTTMVIVLAMGPILLVRSKYTMRFGGTELNVPLPYALLELLPGFNMSRGPARFMGLGMLLFGVLAGFGLRELFRSGKSRWATAAIVLAIIEYLPSAQLTTAAIPPQRLSELSQATNSYPGAVADLPFGAGSALRLSGRLDYSSGLYQAGHGRPRIGGLLSRCSDEQRQQLVNEPILGTLMRLCEGDEPQPGWQERDRAALQQIVAKYDWKYVAVQPIEVGHRALAYLRQLFPDSVEHRLEDDGLWIELQVPE